MSTAIARNFQIGIDPTPSNNFTLYQPSTPDGTLRLGNGNTGITSSLLTLTSAGNLGLGVTPNAWTGTFKALQIGAQGGLSATSTGTFLSANWYTDGTNRYIGTGNATLYQQINGQHAFYTAGSGTAGNAITFTQAMTLDASGNLVLGSTSASYTTSGRVVAYIKGGANGSLLALSGAVGDLGYLWADNAGTKFEIAATGASTPLSFVTNSSERARIDTSGNFAMNGGYILTQSTSQGIGIFASPTVVNNTSRIEMNGTTAAVNPSTLWARANTIIFTRNDAQVESARIDSSGNLLVGTTSASGRLSVLGNSGGTCASFNANSNTVTPVGIIVGGNDTTQAALYVYSNGNGAFNAYIYSNGNLQNRNNSYGGISDARLKENVADATPKLEKLNQVRVVNYNLIGDSQKQLGVIAQELEQIFPGMVEEAPDRDAEGNDLGTTTKSVKYSVFVPMLIKAIQEQQAMIKNLQDAAYAQMEMLNQLKADVAALKGA